MAHLMHLPLFSKYLLSISPVPGSEAKCVHPGSQKEEIKQWFSIHCGQELFGAANFFPCLLGRARSDYVS